jgi:hypothetical protein
VLVEEPACLVGPPHAGVVRDYEEAIDPAADLTAQPSVPRITAR